ncbi:LLM class flavin-dependent oxidoreductase [Streptomyces sp. NBC_01255]|uniref:TIGR03620 family F420-dependent LLM class oxidoreductase n=1 Tax=Streptomyces sp. NBC_01255 TaxID=2903798 RepID=UPI002E32CB72|nr:TIGR03620 family F420-dependent LLM class oxidoreductase [Streptomyces sp. NBC_01255]
MKAVRPHLGRVGIWAGELDTCSAPAVREAVTAIEDLGFGTLWFPETAGREAMAQAAILLSQSERIVVASGSTDIYARDPVTAAAAQRTLEEAFPGRFLLGLWDSHPSLAEDVRGHRFGLPLPTMRAYLDAMDAAPFGPPATAPSPHRVLAALDPGMLALAAERAWGANPLGMPVEHTRNARATLGPTALLAVTQLCVLGPDRAHTTEQARATAAAALPNRRALLRDLGFETAENAQNAETPDDRLIDALVAHGTAEDIARRVHEHLAAGADHVSLHLLTDTPDAPPLRQWQDLAAHLLP